MRLLYQAQQVRPFLVNNDIGHRYAAYVLHLVGVLRAFADENIGTNVELDS